MSEAPVPPFTPEQIAWLDARYRLSLPQLERELQEQGKETPTERKAMTAPDLDAYVQRTATLPWQWGAQDCTIWVADWCLIRWGIDPAARYRGRYDDEAGALALISPGLLATVGPEIPLRRTNDPAEGDIGVIEIMGHQVAAIWSGRHWLFRTPRGIGMTSRSAIAIWGD